MKRKVLSFFFLSLFILLPHTKIHSFDFYLSPIFEYRNSQLGEYVILPEIFSKTNQPWILSELQWQADYIFDLGFKAELIFQNFSFFAKATMALPWENIGYMIDEDFLLFGMDSKDNVEYIYSRSHIDLDFFYDALFGFAWTPFLFENRKPISLGTSLEWRSLQFTSYDGIQFVYFHDKSSGFTPKIFLPGKGITYKQNIFFWWLDAVFCLQLYKNVFSNMIFSYSPFWYGAGYDRHHQRGLDFLDIIKASSAYKIEAEFLFGIKQGDLGLSFAYINVPMKTGISASKSVNDEFYYPSDGVLGGTSLSEFSASIFYRFHFAF